MKLSHSSCLLNASIFILVLWFYYHCSVTTSLDSRWTLPTTLSVIREGNTNLDEYSATITKKKFEGIINSNGHLYNLFPLGPSLVALPIVYLLDTFPNSVLSVFSSLDRFPRAQSFNIMKNRPPIEKLIASLVGAGTTVLIFLLGSSFANRWVGLVGALEFSLATSSLSVASRGLWQHGPSMFFLSLAIFFFIAYRESKIWPLAGFCFAMAYMMRPTNAVPLVVFTVVAFFLDRRRFVSYLLWMSLPLSLFALHNITVYQTLLPPYYSAAQLGSQGHFLEAFAANLISPSRGLFVYSPVLLFAGYGFIKNCREGVVSLIDWACVVTFFTHLIVVSSFSHWWGGHSYGPRFMCDVVPLLIYLSFPALKDLIEGYSRQIVLLRVVWLLSFLISFKMHLLGATHWAAWQWNTRPVNIDRDSSRIWDWKDPQFLRNKAIHVSKGQSPS